MRSLKLLISLVFILFSQLAYAQDSCRGVLIDHKNVHVDQVLIAQLQLYYDNSTGKNCAMMRHAGHTWGQKHYTYVSIAPCHDSSCQMNQSPAPGSQEDYGDYNFYAGPVSINARHKCIYVQGQMKYNGRYHIREIQGHCG